MLSVIVLSLRRGARVTQFPIDARAAGAKAVAEPDSDNEIAASLAVIQLQQGFMTGEMGFRGQVQGIISAAHVAEGSFASFEPAGERVSTSAGCHQYVSH